MTMRRHLLLACSLAASSACIAQPARSADGYEELSVGAGSAYPDLASAVAAALELRAQRPDASIRIVVGSGDYYLREPLRIDGRLSGTASAPTQIIAAAQAAPRLLAGRRLRPQWRPYRDGIVQAKVEGADFDTLFVDGRTQIRARYPNFDLSAKVFDGYAADAIAPERAARWKNPAGGVLHAMHEGRWGDMHIPILGRDDRGGLKLGEAVGNNRPSPPHAVYRYVENVFEELDSPGEWYFDRAAATLYYWPLDRAALDRAKVEVSGPRRLIDIQGRSGAPVRHVQVAGLVFSHTGASYLDDTEPLLRSDWQIAREGAVFVENAEDVRVEGNEFRQLGGNAVFVSGYNRKLRIADNDIRSIGGSAIEAVGRPSAVRSPSFRYEESVGIARIDRTPGPKSPDYPADSRIEGNLIRDIGQLQKQSAGVQLSMAMDIFVAHNTIYDTPRAGINISEGTWGGHVIEYNDVYDTVLETSDHGAFNSWGRDRFWHPDRETMDRINEREPGLWKLDTIKPVTLRYNRFHCEHGWDVDLDDGSSGYRIHHNLMLAGGLKFREGYDRAAWNNILVNNGFHPHVWFKDSGDRFERNIVMAAHQPILMTHWDGVVDYNLLPNEQALEQAQALGLERHGRAGAAGFLDPAKGDFRVASGSPAAALGFENFPMDRFGVVDERLKRKIDRPAPMPALLPLEAGGRSEARDLLGAKVKTLSTFGEQSATGMAEMRGILVLAVEPGSLAERSGLRPNDVIVEALADKFSPTERLDDVGALFGLYQARRWRGEQSLRVMRGQRPIELRLLFAEP